MAAIDLLLGKQQFRTVIGIIKINGSITDPGMPLDAAMSINHDFSANITRNPIEDGSDVTDHIRLENPVLQIEGFIAENPLSAIESAINIATGVVASGLGARFGGFSRIITAAGAGSLIAVLRNRQPGSNINYPQAAYVALKKLWSDRIPFSVRTNLDLFDNMVISKLSFPRSAEIGKSLQFTATFEQVNLVKTATTIVPENLTKRSGAASNQKLGKQPIKTASATNASNSTTLFDLYKRTGS